MKTISSFMDSEIGKILTTILPTIITYKGTYDNFNFKKMSTEPLHIMSGIILALTLYIILTLIQQRLKIIALKKYRDFEMLNFTNFINTEIKKLNDRLVEIENRSEITASELNENEIRLFKEEYKIRTEKIQEYNNSFKSWGIGNYGFGDNTTFYKKLDYKVK